MRVEVEDKLRVITRTRGSTSSGSRTIFLFEIWTATQYSRERPHQGGRLSKFPQSFPLRIGSGSKPEADGWRNRRQVRLIPISIVSCCVKLFAVTHNKRWGALHLSDVTATEHENKDATRVSQLHTTTYFAWLPVNNFVWHSGYVIFRARSRTDVPAAACCTTQFEFFIMKKIKVEGWANTSCPDLELIK